MPPLDADRTLFPPTRRELLPDPESSDDDDAEFGKGAKEAARREAEEDRRLEEAAKGKKRGRKSQEEVVKSVKREKSVKGETSVKREKSGGIRFREEKVKRELLSNEEERIKPTRSVPKSQQTSKADEVGSKWAVKLHAAESSEDDEMGTSEEAAKKGKRKAGRKGKGKGKGKVYSDEEEEKRAHLKGRWRHKHDPEKMTVRRKRLEEKYNPLIKLLGEFFVVVEREHGLTPYLARRDPDRRRRRGRRRR